MLPRASGLALVACAALVGPVQAQMDRTLDFSLALGGAALLGFDTYDDAVALHFFTGKEQVGVQTHYLEEVRSAREGSATLGVRFDQRYLLGLRGRGFSASVRGAPTGAVLPHAPLPATVRGWGVDLLAGLAVPAFGLTLDVFAGPSLTRSSLVSDARSSETFATAVARLAGVPERQVTFPSGLPWTERSWTHVGGLVGMELAVPLGRSLSLGLGFEQRIAPVSRDEMERLHRAEGVPGLTVTYEAFTALPRALTLSGRWTFGQARRRDPGEELLASLRALADSGDAMLVTGTAPPPPVVTDTAAEIRRLEAQLESAKDDVELMGRLGVLLALTAPADERDIRQRERAHALLEEALRREPDNPRWLLGMATVLEKRDMWIDARRVLGRALGAAREDPSRISAPELAEAFYRRGRTLERAVRQLEHLRLAHERSLPVNAAECAGAFCLNWVSPTSFYDQFAGLPDVSDLGERTREAMLREYRRALELDRRHRGAHRALLAAAARLNDWPEVHRLAVAYGAALPTDPWAAVMEAAALHLTGRADAAAALYDAALPTLEESDRALFEDLRPLLRPGDADAWSGLGGPARQLYEDVYWRVNDPLFLSPDSERELEHYTRVALAEIMFGETKSGRRGWETERGQILIRYGLPREVWQIRRDQTKVTPGAATPDDPAFAFEGDGRWIFWNYDRTQPSFIFEQELARSTVRYVFDSPGKFVDQELKKTQPTIFEPPFEPAGAIPHQVARFRGAQSDRAEVVIYGEAPVTALAADSLREGLFLFAGRTQERVVEQRATVAGDDARMDYRVLLPPGDYTYSLEVATPTLDAAAVERGSVSVPAPSAGLALSDLLVASAVTPRAGPLESHRDVSYAPLRCVAVPEGGVVGLVFEVYGLTGDDGRARYRVSIDTGEAAPEGLLLRLVRGARDLIGGESGERLSFEREVELTGDRVLEWFELDLGEAVAGVPTTLSVTVRDELGGGEARATRTLGAPCGSD